MRTPARQPHLTDPGYPALKARIIARTGHHYYVDKDDLLYDRLHRRFRASGVRDATAYAALLASPERGTEEWAALEAEITIGETFFFRYAEQFEALRATILPGLIAARATERSLKIWSAGCSTGAEPYSIAILVHALLGAALPDWHVAITGTDISAEALATARAGAYGRWALRTLPPAERQRYFRPMPASPGPLREGGYALRPEFHGMVRFERHNLLGLLDGASAPAFSGFDLVLCRNVLIYFDAETVAGIVRGLGRRLRTGGWMLLGHAEPNPAFSEWLAPVTLPGTVAYRLPGEGGPDAVPPSAPSGVPAAWAPLPAPEAVPPHAADPLPARGQVRRDEIQPREVPRAAVPSEPVVPHDAHGDLVAIRALADAGETGEAWRRLREALAAAPASAPLRLYEGLLALGLGRMAEAERALRGALYLDRDFVMAHYHLGLVLLTLGRRTDAARALDNAARLSQALAPDALVPEGDGASAAEVGAGAARARAAIGREGA